MFQKHLLLSVSFLLNVSPLPVEEVSDVLDFAGAGVVLVHLGWSSSLPNISDVEGKHYRDNPEQKDGTNGLILY